MPIESPVESPLAAALEAYEPESYWALWQHPEGRYAYMIGFRRDGWLITLDSREAGEAYLASDAAFNGRPLSSYRLDRLTLPEAFAAVRAQPTPFRSSLGTTVRTVLGVELRSENGTRRIPL